MQTIKSIAKGRWPEGHEGPRHSWYEPLTDEAAIGRGVRFVLGEPDLFLNTTSDATLLPLVRRRRDGPARPPDRRRARRRRRPLRHHPAVRRRGPRAHLNVCVSTHPSMRHMC